MNASGFKVGNDVWLDNSDLAVGDTTSLQANELKVGSIVLTSDALNIGGNNGVKVSTGTNNNYITDLDNRTWNAENITIGRAATGYQLKEVANSIGGTVKDVNIKFAGDNNKENPITIKNSETLNINGDEQNVSVNADETGLKVSLANDIDVNSVNIGDSGVVMNKDGFAINKDVIVSKDGFAVGDSNLTTDGLVTNKVTVCASSLTADELKVGSSALTSNELQVSGKTYITGNSINANGQKITGVANGEADTDAVNMNQLKNVSTEAVKHTEVKAADCEENLTVVDKGKDVQHKYEIALDKDLTLDSVKTGNATMDTNGFAIGQNSFTTNGLTISGCKGHDTILIQ